MSLSRTGPVNVSESGFQFYLICRKTLSAPFCSTKEKGFGFWLSFMYSIQQVMSALVVARGMVTLNVCL